MLVLLKSEVSLDPRSFESLAELAESAESVQTAEGFRAARDFVVCQSHEADAVRASTCDNSLFRRKALSLLVYWGSARSAMALISALREDTCPIVRHEAAFYMAFWGQDDFVKPLCEAMLHDPEPLVRHEAAEALGDMGANEARRALEAALSDCSDIVVRTATIALSQLVDGEPVR